VSHNLIKDLAYAGRVLRKSPIFAATAAVTLALGIGASTAIFSVTNAVLLRPLPYQNPDRLVLVFWENQPANRRSFLHSNADFFDLRAGTGAIFDSLGGVASFRPAKTAARNSSARRLSPPISSG
jgi:putative ABC transport system permease protein